jgi:hypothetical protein
MPTQDVNQILKIKFLGYSDPSNPDAKSYMPSESLPKRVNFVHRDYSRVFEPCASGQGNSFLYYDLPNSTNGIPLNGLWVPSNPSILGATNNLDGISYLDSFDITNNQVALTEYEQIGEERWAKKFARVVLNNTVTQGRKLIIESYCSKEFYDQSVVGVRETISLNFTVSQSAVVPVTIIISRRFN